MLRFELSLRYPGFTLEARAAEPCQRLALMGPSGVGKSTLLRALAGLEGHRCGPIHLGGTALATGTSGVPTEGRRLGMVFQRPLLFPHLSAAENLRFARPAAALPISFDEVVSALDLAPVLKRPAHRLSGGEQQRVALGRALLAAPRLLLLDEPFASLDETRRDRALGLIETVLSRGDIALVLATHRLEEAASLCDHLLPLEREGTRSFGAALRLDAALGRAGQPTLLAGEVVQREGQAHFLYEGQAIALPGHRKARPGVAKALVYPDQVRLLAPGAPAPLGCPRFEGTREAREGGGEGLRLGMHHLSVERWDGAPGPGPTVAFTILSARLLPRPNP